MIEKQALLGACFILDIILLRGVVGLNSTFLMYSWQPLVNELRTLIDESMFRD
jgi:hypothetical protein